MGVLGIEVALAGLVVMTLVGAVWDIEQAKSGSRPPCPERFFQEALKERELILLAVLVALFAGLGERIFGEWLPQISYPAWGTLVGMATVWMARAGERCWSGGEHPLTPLLLGATGAGFTGLLSAQLGETSALFGGIMGAVLSAGLSAFWKERKGLWGWDTSWVFSVVSLALVLARQRGEEAFGTALLLLVLAAMVSAIGLQLSSGRWRGAMSGKTFPAHGIFVYYVIFWVGAWLLGSAYLNSSGWFYLVVGGSLLASFCAWLVPYGEGGMGRLFLASLLWVLLATVSFGILRGYGIGVALLSGVLTVQLVGYRWLLPALGLACGLLLFRSFVALYGGEFTTLEIGQHYVFVGILVGALIPITFWEISSWFRDDFPPLSAWVMGLVLGIVVAFGLLWLPLFTGIRGALGFIAGLAFAPLLLAGRAGGGRVSEVVLPIALGAFHVVGYKYVSKAEVWEREEKVRWAIIAGVVLLVLVVVGSWLVSRVRGAGEEVKEGEG